MNNAEKQRVRSLPFMQNELQILEKQQEAEVEYQKCQLAVDELEFLNKKQQPMTFSSESEKRFKTMRSLRKKIRFVNYHLERQRQGKVLSQAELAKVRSLPELELQLKSLESGDTKRVQFQKVPKSGLPLDPEVKHTQVDVEYSDSDDEDIQAMTSPVKVSSPCLGKPPVAPTTNPKPLKGIMKASSNVGTNQAAVDSVSPQSTSIQNIGHSAPAIGVLGSNNGIPQAIAELHDQIEAQRKELEDKQKRIESLMKTQHQVPLPANINLVNSNSNNIPPMPQQMPSYPPPPPVPYSHYSHLQMNNPHLMQQASPSVTRGQQLPFPPNVQVDGYVFFIFFLNLGNSITHTTTHSRCYGYPNMSAQGYNVCPVSPSGGPPPLDSPSMCFF